MYHITNPRSTLGDNVVVSADPQGLGKPNVSEVVVTFDSLNLVLAGTPWFIAVQTYAHRVDFHGIWVLERLTVGQLRRFLTTSGGLATFRFWFADLSAAILKQRQAYTASAVQSFCVDRCKPG